MKDFITGKDIDIQGLLKVAKATEERPSDKFSMKSWGDSDCNTSCCMIGSFCHDNPSDELVLFGSDDGDVYVPILKKHKDFMMPYIFNHMTGIMIRFGLSRRAAIFLFDTEYSTKSRGKETPQEAVKRLYKYIYYKLKKREMLDDLDSAKKLGDYDKEGNYRVGFVNEVFQEVCV